MKEGGGSGRKRESEERERENQRKICTKIGTDKQTG